MNNRRLASETNKRCLLLTGSLIVAFFFGECLVRTFVPEFPGSRVIRIGRERVANPLPGVRYLYKAKTSYSEQWPSDPSGYFDHPGNTLTYYTNNYGFRDENFSIALSQRYRIAVLGDSFCFGAGVRPDDRFSNILENLLNKATLSELEYEVMNFCLPGHNTENEASLYEYVVDAFSPDLVILAFFLNDINRPPELFVDGDALRPKPLTTWATRIRLLEMITRLRDKAIMEREFLKNVAAVYRPSHPAFVSMDAQIERIASVSKRNGRQMLFVIFPWLFKLANDQYPFRDVHALTSRSARARGFQTLDLLASYEGIEARELWVHDVDHHPNALAHRIAANAIFQKIQEMMKNDSTVETAMNARRRNQRIDHRLLETDADWFVPFRKMMTDL